MSDIVASIVKLKKKKKKTEVKSGKVKPDELIIFSRQLAALIESGISLVSSLEILQEQTQNKYFKSDANIDDHQIIKIFEFKVGVYLDQKEVFKIEMEAKWNDLEDELIWFPASFEAKKSNNLKNKQYIELFSIYMKNLIANYQTKV